MTIEEYLKSLEPFIDNAYGRQVRTQFCSISGGSELAVLHSPSREEYEQISRAVAIMTPAEKKNAALLTDDQIEQIAEDARADKALIAIFINGFALTEAKSKK